MMNMVVCAKMQEEQRVKAAHRMPHQTGVGLLHQIQKAISLVGSSSFVFVCGGSMIRAAHRPIGPEKTT